MPKDHVIELEFERGKETKNKMRYEELVEGDEVPVVGSLYVIKSQAEELGEKINVTISNA